MTGSFVIKKNRILEILFFIIIFLVNLKMTLNISDFATANLSILIIGISFISLLFTKIDDNIYWIVLFFILSLFRVEASKMLFVSLLVSISRNLYIDKMAKYSFCLTVLFLIINYGLLILGVLHEEYSDFFCNSGKFLFVPYTKGFGRITHFLGNDLATVLYTAFFLDLLFK